MKRTVGTFALVTALSLAAPAPGEQHNEKKKAAPQMDEKAMMELWAKVATPGAEHKQLEKSAGTWTTASKMWMDPSKPPEASAGTAEMKMVMGGRWLEQHFEGTMMGQPFSGLGYTGYDNYKKKYVSTWMDTATTSVMVTEGTADPKDGTITSTGKIDDFMLKKTVTVKTIIKFPSADTMSFEMWSPGMDGKMMKAVEVNYTRKK